MPGLKRSTIIALILLAATGSLMFIHFLAAGEITMDNQMTSNAPKRILLLGASVGREWNLPAFPSRMKTDQFDVESIAVYQYDKTEALDEILMRPKRRFRLTRTYLTGLFKPAPKRPNLIIIKECAAYFPGDMERYKSLIEHWVKTIRDAKIQLTLATVVPITRDRAERHKGTLEAIRDFNDWISGYAHKEHIPLLDLEAALRTDSQQRYLKSEYTSGDGLHLNRSAYDILDRLLQNTLEAQFPRNPPASS